MKECLKRGVLLVGLLTLGTELEAGTNEWPRAKFEPPAGKVILFVGQDNASVGGNGSYTNGYVDNIGVPGGITHYVYFSPGWKNNFKYTFDKDRVGGLNKETTWGAGPMCMKAYMDSPKLASCLIHLSISMEGNREDKVADGSYDYLIAELVQFLKKYSDRAFLIRIGYEFDGHWNGYDPENFKTAFKRIVDQLRAAQVSNFATVMASSGGEKAGKWEAYYPGDEYVDWVGYSLFRGKDTGRRALDFARKHKKPVFIAEATPKGTFLDKEDGEKAWAGWYKDFFKHIEANLDVIRAISYINCDWDAQPMWDKWGNSRLEANEIVRNKWLEQMKKPYMVEAEDNPLALIGFQTTSKQPVELPGVVKSEVLAGSSLNKRIEAEAADVMEGLKVESCSAGGKYLTAIENNKAIIVRQMDLGEGAFSFAARVANRSDGGVIEIRLDGPEGKLLGNCMVSPSTGGWQIWNTKAADLEPVKGLHDICLRFKGGAGSLFNLDWFTFYGQAQLDRVTWRLSTLANPGVFKGSLNPVAGELNATVVLDPAQTFQRIDGFGGAFNDIGWDVLKQLDVKARDQVMHELFDPESGCRFVYGRVPIGMSDFTTTKDYSLDEKQNDYELASFSIAHDRDLLIPYVKSAKAIQPNLMIHASPWTPPTWMKTRSTWEGKDRKRAVKIRMEPQVLKTYATYFRRFIEEWAKEGIEVFAVFPQNEASYNAAKHPSCDWSGNELLTFMKNYLHPEFVKHDVGSQIWLGTFNCSKYDIYIKPTVEDPVSRSFVRGYGFQWGGAKAMGQTMKVLKDPAIRQMQTENMCHKGANSWQDAEATFRLMSDYFSNGANSYMFWNMVLNANPKAYWLLREQNAMITIAPESGTVLYQPEFYLMKHLSHYVLPGAVCIAYTCSNKDLKVIAFRNPDNSVVSLISCVANQEAKVGIRVGDKTVKLTLPGHSISTILWGGSNDGSAWVANPANNKG